MTIQTLVELFLALLTLGVAWVCLAIARHSVRYRITTQRIEIETGIASVTRRTVDLFRVQDFEVDQPFFLRMRGAGHLVVRSQDTTETEIVLRAIPKVREVHERLRELVAAERRRQHVRVVEESR